MSPLRRLPALGVLLLVPMLVACGDDEEPENAPPTSSSADATEDVSPPQGSPTSATTEATSGPTSGATGLPAACEVITADDVSAAFGVAFGLPEPGGGGHSEQDVEWQSDNCSFEAEDLVEVQLALSGPDDYPGGFTCPEPTAIASTVEPVAGVGDQAFWEVDDSPPLEATLRVCTAAYNLDIDLEYEDGVDFQGDPREQAIALAKAVLAKIG